MIIKKVFFEEIDGQKIFCTLSIMEIMTKKMVIMSHGFRGSSTGPARTFVDFEQKLLQEGYVVLRYDQIGCGNSDGDFLHVSYNQWVKTLVWLTQKYLGQGYKICLMGQSMGGSVTVVATSRPELKGKIPCVLLWVPGVNDVESEEKSDEIYEENGQKY
jgi:alpha-beta hydrolase superfamily lysophospholipase